MSNKKHLYSIIISSAIVILGIVYFAFLKGYLAEARLRDLAEKYALTNPVVKELYEKAHNKEVAYKKDNELTVEEYLSIGFAWKSVADQTRDLAFYNKALAAYEGGIKTYKKKNSLFYINAANLYRELKNYEMAEKRYLQSLELNPGDHVTHLNLIDMYRREMNKPVVEVKARYEAASKQVLNQFPIANSFAGYLREIGEYSRALEFYKVLYESAPRPEFKQAIAELEAELKKKQ